MPSIEWQRATLAARDLLAGGKRVLVSSRGFWSRFNLNILPEDRRNIVRQAAELLRIGNQIEAGSISGTIADAMTDAGLPTTDFVGGLSGSLEGNVHGAGVYGEPEIVAKYLSGLATEEEMGTLRFKAFRLEIPWGASIASLNAAIEQRIIEMGEQYGLGAGAPSPGSLAVY